MRWIALMLIIFAAVVGRGMAWNAMVPIQQTPDEPEHFGYVEQLSHRSTPWLGHDQRSRALEISIEETQSERFSRQPFAQAAWDPARIAANRDELRDLDDLSRERGRRGLNTAGIPPIHYALLAVPQRLVLGRDYLSVLWFPRAMVTVLAAFATVVGIWFVLRLMDDGVDRVIAAAPLLLLPSMGFFTISLNSDVSLFAVFAVASLVLVQLRERAVTKRWLAVLTLVAVAALYVKQSGIVVTPAVLMVVGVDAWRRSLGPRAIVVRAGGMLALIAAAAAPQYLLRTADSTSFLTATPDSTQAISVTTWLTERVPERLATINRGFWGVFGQTDTVASPGAQRIGVVLGIVFVVATLATAVRAIARWRQRDAARGGAGGGIVPLATIPLVYLGLLAATDAQHVISGIEPLGFAQGRHLLPVLPHLGALFAMGVATILPARSPRVMFAGVWLAAMLAIHVDALAGTEVLRYYL